MGELGQINCRLRFGTLKIQEAELISCRKASNSFFVKW